MRRVLIADDEPSIVETTRFILESEGYETEIATNGLEAIAAIRRFRPAVVLLDVMMPEMSGFEVCRQLRREPDLADTCVIILTARGQRSDEASALEAGADSYMRKPFDEEEFLRRVEAVFRTREAR